MGSSSNSCLNSQIKVGKVATCNLRFTVDASIRILEACCSFARFLWTTRLQINTALIQLPEKHHYATHWL